MGEGKIIKEIAEMMGITEYPVRFKRIPESELYKINKRHKVSME
ncbi:hypothetical protein FACS1894200_10510 [Spirochaetia bacterium]|nr:hypothetical protein FACS1894200_10510 [Spirochaetia bacterium]